MRNFAVPALNPEEKTAPEGIANNLRDNAFTEVGDALQQQMIEHCIQESQSIKCASDFVTTPSKIIS